METLNLGFKLSGSSSITKDPQYQALLALLKFPYTNEYALKLELLNTLKETFKNYKYKRKN